MKQPTKISSEMIEVIRRRADLIELIEPFVHDLRKLANCYRGSCPFCDGHDNFGIYPERGFYHCYGCHEAGDAFTFYMKNFDLSYEQAVLKVARWVDVPLSA